MGLHGSAGRNHGSWTSPQCGLPPRVLDLPKSADSGNKDMLIYVARYLWKTTEAKMNKNRTKRDFCTKQCHPSGPSGF